MSSSTNFHRSTALEPPRIPTLYLRRLYLKTHGQIAPSSTGGILPIFIGGIQSEYSCVKSSTGFTYKLNLLALIYIHWPRIYASKERQNMKVAVGAT